MPGYIFPGAFIPGSFFSGGLPTPSDPTSVAKSFKKNSPGCGCCCKCCDQCEGDSPCRIRVNLGGKMFNLKKNGSSALTNGRTQDTTNSCFWVADVDEFTASSCTFDNLLLTLRGPVSGAAYYEWTLLAASGTSVVGRWTKNSGTDAPSCMEPQTLINDHGNAPTDCVSVGGVVIEPELRKVCDPCCHECDGVTPKKWRVTIGAETFILDEHEFGGAHCYWQTSFAARVFGTSPGMGICQDYTGIKLETNSLLISVNLTGGTTPVTWSVGFSSLPDCSATSTLTLQTSNTCSLPTTITIRPIQPTNACGSGGSCNPCASGGPVVNGWKVTVSGMQNDDCTDCSSLNGVYYLPYVGTYNTSLGHVCVYALYFGGTSCAGTDAADTERYGKPISGIGMSLQGEGSGEWSALSPIMGLNFLHFEDEFDFDIWLSGASANRNAFGWTVTAAGSPQGMDCAHTYDTNDVAPTDWLVTPSVRFPPPVYMPCDNDKSGGTRMFFEKY